MRKFLPQFLLGTTALALVGFFLVPHLAHAAGDGTVSGWIMDKVIGSIDGLYGFLARLFSILADILAGFILIIGLGIDIALKLTLDNSFFSSPAINTTWSIIRDLCNMLFIFVLIWLGLRTILNLSDINVKKTITNVVIAAIFINFSLFMTHAIIDVSNIGTAWFVQGVKNVGGGEGVSDSMRSGLKMEKLMDKAKVGDNPGLQQFAAQFARIVIYCVAIYVFFQVAFFLIARIVVFVFLLVTSPVAVMGALEVGDLSKASKDWWDELRAQALAGPMFFLMLYITLYMVDALNNSPIAGLPNSPDPISGSAFGPTDYVMFAIIIFMLLKCLDTAKEYSGKMGGQIAGYLKSATGLALGGVTAGAGLVGRQVIGRTAFNMMQDKNRMGSLQADAAKGVFSLSGIAARTQLATLNKAATSSYDARATKVGGSVVGAFGPTLSVAGVKVDGSKVGKAESGGYKAGYDEFEKAEKEYAEKNLGKGKQGEANRLAYSQNRMWNENAWYYKYGGKYIGMGVGNKARGEVSDAAYKAYSKAETEGAQKDAQKIKNQLIDEQTAMENLKKAAKTEQPDEMNTALKKEEERITTLAKKFQEDKDNKLAYNRYKKIEARKKADKLYAENGPFDKEAQGLDEEIKRLDKEFDDATKTMTEAEKTTITDDSTGKVKKVTDFETYLDAHKKALENAKKETTVRAKKQMIEKVNENTINVRIGKPSTDWDPNLNGTNKGGFRNKGGGLSEELRGKMKEIQDKKREQDILDGKTPKSSKKGNKNEPAAPVLPSADDDATDDTP